MGNILRHMLWPSGVWHIVYCQLVVSRSACLVIYSIFVIQMGFFLVVVRINSDNTGVSLLIACVSCRH